MAKKAAKKTAKKAAPEAEVEVEVAPEPTPEPAIAAEPTCYVRGKADKRSKNNCGNNRVMTHEESRKVKY